MAAEPDRSNVPGLALRALVAATATIAFLIARDTLSPRALVAARFGLGVTLFALLVDAGRKIAGQAPPVSDRLTPHRQRATEQVDEAYDRVRNAVERFVEDGVVSRALEDTVREACQARGFTDTHERRALENLHEVAGKGPDTHRPVALGLLAGAGITVGLVLAVATVAENLGLPVLSPIMIVGGVSVTMLQLRARRSNANHTALALGLVGSTVTGLGGLQIGANTVPGLLVLGLAGAGLGGSIYAWYTHDPRPEPWRRVRADMKRNLASLRRAFLATLAVGIVLFPLKPLVAPIAEAAGFPFETPYQLAAIAFVTVATYIALEGAGTWIALARGQRTASRLREQRLNVTDEILDELDRQAGHTPQGGTP